MVRGVLGKLALGAIALVACSRGGPEGRGTALSAKTPSSSAHPPKDRAPAWFADDYTAALAAARASKRPLFVDASAVWCHTCLSMRAFVFDDPALDRSEFVWLSFDVEGQKNAELAARYPAKVLPTFFIVDAT